MSATGNERLKALLDETDWSRKAFARAVRELAAARKIDVSCTHTDVGRWLSGMRPREATGALIVEVLSRRLGRALTMDEVGLAASRAVDPATGLDYASEPVGASLVTLLTADTSADATIAGTGIVSSAWTDAALSWLIRVSPSTDGAPPDVRSVGISDVEALRTTTKAFSDLDNRFGGQHARNALATFLRDSVKPLLAASHHDEVGRQLFQAAAEATLLLAWMTYDACRHGLAQRYFIQALRLADAADDPVLGGSILDAMSHQARFVGRFNDSVTLARAALTAGGGQLTAIEKAHFFAMEARAQAGAGDATATDRAVASMLTNFGRRRDDQTPGWLTYVDDGELAAELAHCFRDLGRYSEAIEFATMATEYAGASARSDFFVTMVLADAQLASGEAELACMTAQSALSLGDALRSARAAQYVKEFRSRLAAAIDSPGVADLVVPFEAHPLWKAAG